MTFSTQNLPKWVMKYNKLTAFYDEVSDMVMLVENYGPLKGFFVEGWRAFHFPRTSAIVKKSYREGNNSIFLIKPGTTELSLVPAFAPIGIESCMVSESEIQVVYAGYGGGGVSAAYSRGLADGVLRTEVLQAGGGGNLGKGLVILPKRKLVLIGVDDTDNPKEGATYALAHNIAVDIQKSTKGVEYLTHGNIQLFPYNPDKTKNCFSTVIGFSVMPNQVDTVVKKFKKLLTKYTLSQNTAMCYTDSFAISSSLLAYAKRAKASFISSLEEVKKVAKKNHITCFPITGERGLIGAVAAIGLYDQPDYASSLLPNQKFE
jgi:methanogenesis imperfect marker protein 11